MLGRVEDMEEKEAATKGQKTMQERPGMISDLADRQTDIWPDTEEPSSHPGVSAPFLTKPVSGTSNLDSLLDFCSPQ